MNKQQISINKIHALYLPAHEAQESAKPSIRISQMVGALGAKMMSYGYMPSQRLHNALLAQDEATLIALHDEAMPVLQKNKGAHVQHRPMYTNFPAQVMEMEEFELWLNAITHYWTGGTWMPNDTKLPRELAFETTKWVELGVAGDQQFNGIFASILSSNDSISEDDRAIVRFFMAQEGAQAMLPDTIPFKENLCTVAAIAIEQGDAAPSLLEGMLKTSTDILRVITSLNGGDISLAGNTRFRSMPRRQRRMWVNLLEKVIRAEDIHRHRGKWTRLFHTLHVGEYRQAERTNIIAKKIRNNETIRTFNGRVELAIQRGDAEEAISVLSQRPGEFARRLDHLFRTFNDEDDRRVIDGFLKVADQVPTRILCQLMGHLKARLSGANRDGRVVFPKGQMGKARIIATPADINQLQAKQLYAALSACLVERFSEAGDLGKVYIDPGLHDCPLPTGQRSASPGAMTVARGTQMPFGDETKTTLRFFIYWVGRDIDLSATLHDENFNMVERIAYTNLKSAHYQACHSGDITNAPQGASEFIDITIDDAAKSGIRYVVMNVLVYSGPNFKEHSQCFAGWMTRSKPKSNEIFDPKTVEGKADLCSDSRNAIPVVFDLVERKAIWTDLVTSGGPRWGVGGFQSGWASGGNNVEANRASIEQTTKAIIQTKESRLSLYDLFLFHTMGRGEMITERAEADTVFALQPGEGVVSPYDINTINSEFLA